jgi:hypothetical protein|tara:strand:- start:253 stop:1653 length:1401 start_codon:yes stop_codon:yes gene_type:complete
MAQLRIKRSTGSTAPSSSALANAELAFTESNEILFLGKGTSGSNAASVVKVGGVGAFCDLETAQTIGGAKTFSSNVIVSGNLTVNGTTTSVSTTNTTVSDNILELNSGASENGNDCGILIERGSTGNNAFIGWDESADQFIVGTTTATADSTGNLSISTGTLQANVTGSAVSLANSRNIELTGDVTGSASFNGTANASIAATIASGSVERTMLNLVSTSSDPGLTVKGDGTTDGYLQLNCSQNSHGIKLKSPAHSAGASYTLTFPTSDGSDNQLLKTDGSGGLDWVTLTGGAGITVTNHAISVTNDSITEAMLDIHNSPTDGYILKYDNTNGLVWEAAGAGGDVNQNAFSNIAVSGQDTVAAESATDTATFVGAGGLTITTNASSDEITFTIGTLNQNTTGNAATATTASTATNVNATANNSTDETVYLTFVDGNTGSQGIETDTGLSYNPSSGLLTVGVIDGGSF